MQNTALHYAAVYDAAEATEFLLSHGAKIMEDASGRTPMDLAIFHRSEQSAMAFLKDIKWKRTVMCSSKENGTVLLGLIQHLPGVMLVSSLASFEITINRAYALGEFVFHEEVY